MQRGRLAIVSRKQDPDVWQFRWSEKDSHRVRVQRKRTIGTVERYQGEAAARTAKGTQKRHENVPFWLLDGFARSCTSALE